MINIDEAIKGEENIADACEEQANMKGLDDPYARNVAYENGKCEEMHKQIAEWLKEQETILDKIEDEIEQLPTILVKVQRPHSVVYRDVVELGLVLRIIDKYKNGNEGKE